MDELRSAHGTADDLQDDSAHTNTDKQASGEWPRVNDGDDYDEVTRSKRSDYMTVSPVEARTRPTTEAEAVNQRWENTLEEMRDRFGATAPSYRSILIELENAPHGLAGSLNEQITALANEVRAAQANERIHRLEATRKLLARVELWIDEKIPALQHALEPELYPPDSEPDAELSITYRDFADNERWGPAKRDAFREYLRYWLDNDRYDTDKSKQFPWLREQRNRLELVPDLDQDLRDILALLRTKIDDASLLGDLYNSRKEGGRYVQLIKKLDEKRRSGIFNDYEVTQTGEYRVNDEGVPITYSVLKRLSEIQVEYVEYCLRVANDKLVEATGLTLAQWRAGAVGLKHNADLTLIETALRTGLINRDPGRQHLPDYKYISITIDLSIPPDKGLLKSETARQDFDDVLVALDAALKLVLQVKDYSSSRHLDELYRFVVPYYTNAVLLGEVKRLEDREAEMLRHDVELLTQVAPEQREDGAFVALHERIEQSAFNQQFAPNDKRDLIDELLKEYTRLERETRIAKNRFREAQEQLKQLETMLTTRPPNLVGARSVVIGLNDQLTQNEEYLTASQKLVFDRLVEQLTILEGFDSILSEAQRRYKAALDKLKNGAAWRSALEYSKLHFGDESQTKGGNQRQRDEGRKIYLHALARDSYLRAILQQHIDPNARAGESREDLLNRASEALSQLEQVLALLDEHLDDVQTLKNEIAADSEEIALRRQTMAGVEKAAERASTHYGSDNYFERDYVAAYEAINEFEDENTTSEGNKAVHLRRLADTWIRDTEAAVRTLINRGDAKQLTERDGLPLALLETQLKMLDTHIEYFDKIGYMITPTVSSSYTIYSNNAWQHIFNEKHRDITSEPLDTEFRLPLAFDDYKKWYGLVRRLSASQIRQQQESEIAAYLTLSWMISGSSYTTDSIIKDLKRVLSDPSFFSLPTQISDAPGQANRLLIYDALLLQQTRYVIEQFRLRTNTSSDAALPEPLARQLKDARSIYQQLVYVASTPAANYLVRLWSEWLSVIEAYLSSNMSYALQKIDMLLKEPIPTANTDGEMTGWLRRRMVYVHDEAKGIRNNVQTLVSSELRRASVTGGRPEDFARLIEYSFLLLRVNPNASEAKAVIYGIILQLPAVYSYYKSEIKTVLDGYLPISIDTAVEKMSSLVAKIDLNSVGFCSEVGRHFLQEYQRGDREPMDNLFSQLSENANALSNSLRIAQSNYETTRRALYGILKNEPGYNNNRVWNWGSFEQKLGDLHTTLVGITTLIGNSFDHYLAVNAIKWFNELDQLGRDIVTQLNFIRDYDNEINDTINRQNQYQRQDIEDSPRGRYDRALVLLTSTRTAVNTIAERIREHFPTIFAGQEEFVFTYPSSFFVTPLPRHITIPRKDDESEINITRLEGITQHEDILKRLRQQAQGWEAWVDSLVNQYESAVTQNNGLKRWHEHFTMLKRDGFGGAWVEYSRIRYAWAQIHDLYNIYNAIDAPKYDRLLPESGPPGAIETFETTIGELRRLRDTPQLVIPPDMMHVYVARLHLILNEPFFQVNYDNTPRALAAYLDDWCNHALAGVQKLREDLEFVRAAVYTLDIDIAWYTDEITKYERRRHLNNENRTQLENYRGDRDAMYQVRAVLTAAPKDRS